MKMNAIPMKQWVYTEAERIGVTPKTIRRRMWRGKYDDALIRMAKNKRVILVLMVGKPKPTFSGRPRI